MELLILASLTIGAYLVTRRAKISQSRLQACINNGSAFFDGKSINIARDISDLAKRKIRAEILIYRQWVLVFPGSLKLSRRNDYQ